MDQQKKFTTAKRPTLTAPELLTTPVNNPSICRLIAESVKNPLSPLTQSPAGSGELWSILQRLEVLEIESRDLLQRIFSMVQTDVRLERYIRKRIQDPKVSRIWELIETLLATQQGKLDIQAMLNDDDGVSDFPSLAVVTEVKGVKGRDEGVMKGRFKVRQFDMCEAVVAQPYYPTVKK